MFTIASGLIISGFVLLSSFTEITPVWIASFLIFGNVGQSLMQIAMSNSMSRTLPPDQAGAGMGLFSMTSFMAHEIGSVVYGLAADLSPAASWNPLYTGSVSTIFSNLYLLMAVLHAGILLIYRWKFNPVTSKDSAEPAISKK